MQITKRNKIEKLAHGDLFSGRLRVVRFWWGDGHLNLVCKTHEGARVRVKSFIEEGHTLKKMIEKLAPKVTDRWDGRNQSTKILNFFRLIAAEVPPGRRARDSDFDVDLSFDGASDVIVGNPKSTSYEEISKILKKDVSNFMDFVNGVYLWSYGAVTEDGVETDLQSGKYLSFTLVNGQNRNIRLFIICNSETKTSLQHLGAGSEVLVYGKVHVVENSQTRLFVNDPENVQIQNVRLLKNTAIRQKTTDPQKLVK